MTPPRPARRAFTLLEVILALALGTLLVGALLGFLWNIASARERLLERSRHTATATFILDTLEEDLVGAFAGGGPGAGFRGDAISLRFAAYGVTFAGIHTAADDDADTAPSPSPTPRQDVATVECTFDPDAGTLRYTRRAPGEPGGREPPGQPLGRVAFRYFDGRAWSSAFDSAQTGGLPAAVEVAIWLTPATPAADGGAAPSAARPPDRLRVIRIPDGGAPATETARPAGAGGGA